MKYKILCHDVDWLPRGGEGTGIKLWKEDSEGRSLWPRGDPDSLKPSSMRHLPEVVKGLFDFVDHWEQSSRESFEARQCYEPLSSYWRNVRDALTLPMDTPTSLQDGFWPATRIAHALQDEFTAAGDYREEYAEDDHFVGQRRDRPEPSFRVGCDVFAGYFVALRPCDSDERPVWIARATSDPFTNPDRPGCIELQYYQPSSRDRDVLRLYTNWDNHAKFKWILDTSAALT